jgi:hypothetical protein
MPSASIDLSRQRYFNMARISLRGAWKSLFTRKTAARRTRLSDNLRRLRAEQLEPRDLFAYAPDPNFGLNGAVFTPLPP